VSVAWPSEPALPTVRPGRPGGGPSPVPSRVGSIGIAGRRPRITSSRCFLDARSNPGGAFTRRREGSEDQSQPIWRRCSQAHKRRGNPPFEGGDLPGTCRDPPAGDLPRQKPRSEGSREPAANLPWQPCRTCRGVYEVTPRRQPPAGGRRFGRRGGGRLGAGRWHRLSVRPATLNPPSINIGATQGSSQHLGYSWSVSWRSTHRETQSREPFPEGEPLRQGGLVTASKQDFYTIGPPA
jgi:hypothetical protein